MDQYGSRLQKVIIVIGNGMTLAANFPQLVGIVPASQVVNMAAGGLVALTRVAVAHGLGYRPNPAAIQVQWVGADTDAVAAIALGVTKTDTASIFVKPSAAQVTAAEIAYIITIDLDVDIGGRNQANQAA